jgi:hypothetical protein
LVNFHAPGSVSGSAFPIGIRIQDSQINADISSPVVLHLKGGKVHTKDCDVFIVMLEKEDYAAVK